MVNSMQKKKVDLKAGLGEQTSRAGCLLNFVKSLIVPNDFSVCLSFQIACLVPVDQFQLYKRLKFERGMSPFGFYYLNF